MGGWMDEGAKINEGAKRSELSVPESGRFSALLTPSRER